MFNFSKIKVYGHFSLITTDLILVRVFVLSETVLVLALDEP